MKCEKDLRAVNSEQVKISVITKKRKRTVFRRQPTAGWQAAQGPSYVGVETHSPPEEKQERRGGKRRGGERRGGKRRGGERRRFTHKNR